MTPSIKKAPVLLLVLGALAVLATVLVLSLANRAAPQAALPADANTGWATQGVPLLGAGPLAPVWASLGMADWLVKILLAALALVPFRMAIDKILSRPA